MHNWYEVYLVGREKTTDALHMAEAFRRADRAAKPSLPRQLASIPAARRSRLDLGDRRAAEGARATLVLAGGEVLSFRVRGRPSRITCVAGRLWVTAEGMVSDYVLAPGEGATFSTRGRLVIEALRTATLRIDCPRPVRVTVGLPLRAAAQLR